MGGGRMPQKSVWGDYAESRADAAAGREGEEKQTDALGEGPAAVAYALLDVAHAIREHTEATQ
ncbi:hypothetical protein M2158_004576 [Streptomyces sp. SAI-144]|nr:hypothetical protein [Streptomyces sp. SAI-144]